MRYLPSLCLSAAVVAIQIPSQSTLSVGPGGYAEIRDALAAAQPGDTLLVQPGIYAHFTAAIGVTIRAAVPGSVLVAYDATLMPAGCGTDPTCLTQEGPTYLQPPPGQPLHLIGLTFLPTLATAGFYTLAHRVVITGGTVSMDGCLVRSAATNTLTIEGAVVSLQGCSILNESSVGLLTPALYANHATVTANDCTMMGGPPTQTGYAGSEGIKLDFSTLHGSHLTVRGGLAFLQAGGPAVRATGSKLWLSDSHLEAGNAVCALIVGGSDSRLARCTVVSNGGGCSQPAAASLLGVHRPQPMTLGSTFALEFQTEANGFVFLSASQGLIGAPLLETVQPLSLHPATLVFAGVYFADATGLASGSWNVPNHPALVDATLWFQGATGFAFPLQMTPVAGGVIR